MKMIKENEVIPMIKAAVFFANGFEEVEALTVVDLLRRAEFDLDMVSINNEKSVTGSHNITIQTDLLLNNLDFDSYDLLVLPGGMPGTTNLANCTVLCDALREHNSKGKTLAAICAAPTVFGELGLLQGKKACCYPGMEGGLPFAKPTTLPVTTDANIITSRGVGTAIPFALTIIEAFKGKDVRDALAKSIVFE